MLAIGLAYIRIVDIGQRRDLELAVLDAHALFLVRNAMILPLLRSAIRVVLRTLVRCSSRKRDSTSMVRLADAQPMKSTPWKMGTRKERIGKPVSGLIAGSVIASVRVVLAV